MTGSTRSLAREVARIVLQVLSNVNKLREIWNASHGIRNNFQASSVFRRSQNGGLGRICRQEPILAHNDLEHIARSPTIAVPSQRRWNLPIIRFTGRAGFQTQPVAKSRLRVDTLAVGVDRIQRNFEPMRRQVEEWRQVQITDRNTGSVASFIFVEYSPAMGADSP
jgi:hypothetical protein